jgi:hypothetical protein
MDERGLERAAVLLQEVHVQRTALHLVVARVGGGQHVHEVPHARLHVPVLNAHGREAELHVVRDALLALPRFPRTKVAAAATAPAPATASAATPCAAAAATACTRARTRTRTSTSATAPAAAARARGATVSVAAVAGCHPGRKRVPRAPSPAAAGEASPATAPPAAGHAVAAPRVLIHAICDDTGGPARHAQERMGGTGVGVRIAKRHRTTEPAPGTQAHRLG